MILTDDDKLGIAETVVHMDFTESFTDCIDRVCELAQAAVIAKLAGVSVEPAAKVTGAEHLRGMVWTTSETGFRCEVGEHLYTSTAIAAARMQAIEECAKVCEEALKEHKLHSNFICANAIRALIGGST